ncbi:hypothetical protein B0H11DRAFT_1910531 [Mycena galericulata]|nr:hypothetical protein B0H11DRAFT_1910531 [Mycena galericulata]
MYAVQHTPRGRGPGTVIVGTLSKTDLCPGDVGTLWEHIPLSTPRPVFQGSEMNLKLPEGLRINVLALNGVLLVDGLRVVYEKIQTPTIGNKPHHQYLMRGKHRTSLGPARAPSMIWSGFTDKRRPSLAYDLYNGTRSFPFEYHIRKQCCIATFYGDLSRPEQRNEGSYGKSEQTVLFGMVLAIFCQFPAKDQGSRKAVRLSGLYAATGVWDSRLQRCIIQS